MRRMLVFASRNQKEIMRDPLTYIFGIGLPVLLLVLLTAINKAVPETPFAVESFAPGMAVFSLAFISLFAGLLVAKDRASSFLMRAFASPMTAFDFLAGYALPLLLMAALQSIVCFIAAAFIGLPITWRTALALAVLLAVAILYIAIGLLMGTIMSDKQVGGIASLIINIATLMSGTWFPLEILGEGIRSVCLALPFAHAVNAVKLAISGGGGIITELLWVLGYAAVLMALAVWLFSKKMKSGKV